ncbi:MAG: ATP-binding protein, partial [Acidobacteriota bacterium]
MAARPPIDQVIERLLAEWGSIASRHIAGVAGVSRQTAHTHLRKMVESGRLIREGAGRGVHYRRAQPRHHFIYQRQGLEEHKVWEEVRQEVPDLAGLPERVEEIFQYALTELANNAIDHSESKIVELWFRRANDRLVLEVIDQGTGIFDHLVDRLGFKSKLIALQELSKGGVTTLPDQHTGEGLFFVA